MSRGCIIPDTFIKLIHMLLADAISAHCRIEECKMFAYPRLHSYKARARRLGYLSCTNRRELLVFYTLLSSMPRPMVHFSDDSEQYTSWKKVGDPATYLAVSRRLRNTWAYPSFKILSRRTALRQRHWPLPLSTKSDLSTIHV